MLEWFSNIKPITYQCYTIQPILNLQTIKLNHFRTIQAILLIKLLNNINIFSQKINTFFHFFQDCFFIGFSTTQAGDKVLAIWDSLHGKLDKKTKFTILCKWNAHPLSLETPETRTVCNRPLMRLSPFASVSKRVLVWKLSYENVFPLQVQIKLVFISKVLHEDLFWNGGTRLFGNRLLKCIFLCALQRCLHTSGSAILLTYNEYKLRRVLNLPTRQARKIHCLISVFHVKFHAKNGFHIGFVGEI